MIRILLGIVAMVGCATVVAQPTTDAYTDAWRDSTLSYDEYLSLVKANHPVAIIANLEVEMAERDLQRSRGGFDPALYGNYSTKQFKNVGYYEDLNAGIVVPTWMGLSFQAGYQSTGGDFLNPEKVTPGAGLINAGVTAELGAGLLMDSRRAALRQAQIGLEQGQVERTLLLNQLYFEATNAYFNWALAEEALRIAENALELANNRYEFTTQSYKFGDLPAIDTVEAYTQVLNRLFRVREAQTKWVESVNVVNVFLWDDDYSAMEVPPGVRPDTLINSPLILDEMSLVIDGRHPELYRLRNQREIVDIDRRLAAEFLRPRVMLKYNFLSENAWNNPELDWFGDSRLFVDNYDFGARVTMPLFVREARGRVGMTKVRMQMIDQDYFNLEASLNASLNSALVEMRNLRDQVNFFETNVSYLGRLLDGERQLFQNGESSLFLINARETQLVDGENVFFQLLAKERILFAEIRVIAGKGFPE